MRQASIYINALISAGSGGKPDLQAITCAMLARLELARGNAEDAREAMREVERLAGEHAFSPRRNIILNCEMARYWLALGNVEKAGQIVKKNSLSINDEIPYLREPEYVLLVRILLAQNDHAAAIQLCKKLLKQTEQAERMGLVIEILILQARAFQGMKEIEKALAALERALIIGTTRGVCARISG